MGKLCEQMAGDGLSAQRKEGLADAITVLLGSKPKTPLTAGNLGQARDFLVEAIAAKYPDSPDKLDAFLDALASHMGGNYPLETQKNHFFV